jgi:hypothetical protein
MKLAGVAIWQLHIGNFIPPGCSGIAADAQFDTMPILYFFLIERLTQPQVSAKLHANWDVGALGGRHVCKRE